MSLLPLPEPQGVLFPEQLTAKYQPSCLEDFAGLPKIKNIMRSLIADPKVSGWLLYGESGLGKTSMGLVLARLLPAQLHHIPSSECTLARIQRVWESCQYIPLPLDDGQPRLWNVVLVEEADQMTEGASNAFLSILDGTKPAPRTIWVFTANSIDRLEKRFRSRCKPLEFSNYGIAADAIELMRRIWAKEANGAPEPNFQRIVKESNNNIREAINGLELELMSL